MVVRKVGKSELGRRSGEGTVAKVKYASEHANGECVAMKTVDHRSTIKRKKNYGKSWWIAFKNEIYTLSKIEHMNLVKLYGFPEHEDDKVIVVEYVSNGTRREHLDGFSKFIKTQVYTVIAFKWNNVLRLRLM
ncbi:unnamed protein product [Microthlaspi erraticum]|uniref:non-specific serine/threonine protein kinase n=1 Tax=Microthlaspi erraticum TaxID=1685480 RepID=A0A6D2KA91_9BRAS|nr:unnamed protein product [Microthlaspi erraticum]